MPPKDIGKRIRAARDERGISRKVLAKKCKVSLRTLFNIENGVVVPHGETLKKILETLQEIPKLPSI